ncbi:DUF2716 domain-containing protein [Streptomyces sp. SID1046]|nr:DUF2716 domain-containing protein [Streptomyces sp. SID1046]
MPFQVRNQLLPPGGYELLFDVCKVVEVAVGIRESGRQLIKAQGEIIRCPSVFQSVLLVSFRPHRACRCRPPRSGAGSRNGLSNRPLTTEFGAAGHTTALLHRPEPRPPVQPLPLGALRPAVPGDRSTGVAGAARLGTFGHPWEQTLTVRGRRLLDAVEEELTVLLGEPIRRRDRGRTPRAVGGPTSRGVARRGRRPGGLRPPATG